MKPSVSGQSKPESPTTTGVAKLFATPFLLIIFDEKGKINV
jgi:hypothetical protein